jgi:hypothetical protein
MSIAVNVTMVVWFLVDRLPYVPSHLHLPAALHASRPYSADKRGARLRY